MAGRRSLSAAVEIDTDQARRDLRRLGQEVTDAGDAMDSAAKDTGKLEDASKDAAVDVDKLADRLRDSGRQTKDFGADTEKAGRQIGDVYDEVEGGAHGTASAIGEAFGEGGDIQSGLGSATEAVESFAEMFGPAGMIVSFIGGAAIGALTNFMDKSKEMSEAVAARAEELADVLLESSGKLKKAYVDEQVFDFIKANGEAFDAITAVEGGMNDLSEAFAGNTTAAGRLIDKLNDKRAADRRDLQLLQAKERSVEGLTDEEYQLLDALRGRIKATDRGISALRDERSAFREAGSAVDRQTTYLKRNKDAQNVSAKAARENTEAQRRLAAAAAETRAQIERQNAALGRKGPTGAAAIGSGRAGGGPVEAGTAYTVGEYGREMFVPAVDGTIVPNHALGRAAPTVVLHQTIVSDSPERVATRTARALARHAFRQG